MPLDAANRKAEISHRKERIAMTSKNELRSITMRLILFAIALCLGAAAHAQTFYVDCSGATPSEFSSIGAALAVAGPNSYVIVTSTAPCNENVYISNFSNLNLGAFWGVGPTTIVGNVNITASNTVLLYGVSVTNPNGNGIDISSSHNVTLMNSFSNGNAGTGMTASNLSDVTVVGPGSFDSNSYEGMNLGGNSTVTINNWAGGTLDISGNQGPGVWLSGASFETIGTTTITNNVNPPGATPPTGYGIQALGASKVQIGTCYGPNLIAGNQTGGLDAEENTEVSFWSCGNPSVQTSITNNGTVGISAGLGSQVTLYDNAQITGHTGPGVELYGNSQLRTFSANLISNNGSAGDPRSAGIVVDGNSEAYLRGGTITTNQGPGILVLVNSSVDSEGATFSANTGGNFSCDSSSYGVSDLIPPSGASAGCRSPHKLGSRRGLTAAPKAFNLNAGKSQAALYKKFASHK
jgi:hypothetical protein